MSNALARATRGRITGDAVVGVAVPTAPGAGSPAEVLRVALVAYAVGVLPSAGGDWPIYVGHLPDEPDDAICVYDTGGVRNGRLQGSGTSIEKPGWQIRVRADAHTDAHAKMKEVQGILDTIRRLQVVVGGVGYTIAAVTQTSGVLSLGQEPDAKRRIAFTLNGTLTHTED